MSNKGKILPVSGFILETKQKCGRNAIITFVNSAISGVISLVSIYP